MRYIQTDNALKPNGHYAQAVEHEGFIFLSGILPFDNETGVFVKGTIAEQMAAVLANLDCVLEAGGSSAGQVLKTTIYISDIEMWNQINDIYSEYFKHHTPARSIIAVASLHFSAHIEMEAIAYKQ